MRIADHPREALTSYYEGQYIYVLVRCHEVREHAFNQRKRRAADGLKPIATSRRRATRSHSFLQVLRSSGRR